MPNTQEQELNTAAASEAQLGDSIDTQGNNRESTYHSGEPHFETTTADVQDPLVVTNSSINSSLQPLPATTNGNMLSSALTNGSASIDNIQQHEPAKKPMQQQSRRGSAYPDQCWGAGDAVLGSSGHEKKTLVLCFDGTGNKFKGNSGDTNILKIFSMLDRRKGDQYHYYQREFMTIHINTPTHWIGF